MKHRWGIGQKYMIGFEYMFFCLALKENETWLLMEENEEITVCVGGVTAVSEPFLLLLLRQVRHSHAFHNQGRDE